MRGSGRAGIADLASSLLELGATGSFLELQRPTNKLPAMGYMQRANLTRAQEFAASLPQLYHVIGITVGQIRRMVDAQVLQVWAH